MQKATGSARIRHVSGSTMSTFRQKVTMNRILLVSLALFLYLVSLDTVVFGADDNPATASWIDRYYVFPVLMLVLSIISTTFAGWKWLQNEDLKKQRRTLEQAVVNERARAVCRRIHKGGFEPFRKKVVEPFEPDFIFAPDIRSIPVAHLVEDVLEDMQGKPIPILLGLCFFRAEIQLANIPGGKTFRRLENDDHEVDIEIRKRFPQIGGFDFIGVTEKWANYVPRYTGISSKSRVLIVDDYCESGSSIRQLMDYFTDKYGIEECNIRATCLVTRPKAPFPPYYPMEVDEHVERLPWGFIR